jgi:hypothetical protein
LVKIPNNIMADLSPEQMVDIRRAFPTGNVVIILSEIELSTGQIAFDELVRMRDNIDRDLADTKSAPIQPPKPPPVFTINFRPGLATIIGRQRGQRRNRVHVYCQPYGYPIRLCDWVAVDKESIEQPDITIGIKQILYTLIHRLIGEQLCQHCVDIMTGKRAGRTGMENHGHGQNAPLPS